MTKELEPLKECPFCGSYSPYPGEHEEGCYLRIWSDTKEDWYTHGFNQKPEDFDIAKAEEHVHDRHSGDDLRAAWNHRYKRTCKMQDALNVPDSDPFDEATDLDGRLENLIRHVADICGAEVVDD